MKTQLGLNLQKLNSATKYPSIPTYHDLGPGGFLQETGNPFADLGDETVYVTEKIDGSNARIICVDDDWYIGSREELLTAKDDRVPNSVLGIVEALQSRVPSHRWTSGAAAVYYVEVYGRREQPAWRTYGDGTVSGVRLFDIAYIPLAVLELSNETIASWRDQGRQGYMSPKILEERARETTLPLVPTLFTMPAKDLPITVAEMHHFMIAAAPQTRAHLSQSLPRPERPEGIVLRTADRRSIYKARFQSYERTLFPQQGKKKKVGVPGAGDGPTA